MNIGFEQTSPWNQEDMSAVSAFLFIDDGFGWHWHHYIEILYIVSGQFLIHINQEDHICNEGDLIFIDVDEPHLTQRKSDTGYILTLQCSDEYIRSSIMEWFEARYLSSLTNGKFPFLRKVTLQKGNELQKILIDTVEEFQNKNLFYELCLRANVMKILALYLRNYQSDALQESSAVSNNLEKLMPVLLYCRKNYMRPISQKSMAKYVYLSVSYFCKIFKETLGMSFTEYINNIRIDEAKKLIVATDMSFVNIAMEVGFGNVTYFNRVFKNRLGITPSEHRRHYRQSDKVLLIQKDIHPENVQ